MTQEQAEKLVDRLLAGFPQLNLRDPEGYISALIQVMLDYPLWAGEQAVVQRLSDSPDFPPSDRRLRLWLADIVSPHRFVRDWNTRTKQQLEERQQLEPDLSKPIAEPEGRVVSYAQYLETNPKGRPIGVFESENRKVPYRG